MSLGWEGWQVLGAKPLVVEVLNAGYCIPFVSRPMLSSFPKTLWGLFSPLREQERALSEEFLILQWKGAVESVSLSGVLQPCLCGIPGLKQFLPSDRFVFPELFYPQDKVLDANQHISAFSNLQHRLNPVSGPLGCLLSDSSPSREQLVSLPHLGGPSC